MTISTGIKNAHALGKYLLKENNFQMGLCCFGTVGAGGKGQRTMQMHAACHAALKRLDTSSPYVPAKVVDVLYEPKSSLIPATSKQRLAWYSFILERSVYSPMFAERKASVGHKRGYFIYHADVNANILAAGAIAIRMASEKPRIVQFFCGLVEAGADEDISFILAHTMFREFDKVGVTQGGIMSHVAIAPSYMSKANLSRYFKADVVWHGTYAENRRYDDINFMFGEEYGNATSKVNVVTDVNKIWDKAIKSLANKDERRVALFNLAWNKADISKNRALEKEQAYPLLAKLINNYKQEVLNGA